MSLWPTKNTESVQKLISLHKLIGFVWLPFLHVLCELMGEAPSLLDLGAEVRSFYRQQEDP